MTGILIFLLFMLNMLLMLAVVLLYLRQNRFMEMENNQRKIQAESEEILSAFLMELKEENEHFISIVNKLQKEKETSTPSMVETLPLDEAIKERNNQEVASELEVPIHIESYTRMLASNVYGQETNVNVVDIQTEEEDQSFENKTFREQVEYLSEQGFSVEEIAKALQKGKTEVELIRKFR